MILYLLKRVWGSLYSGREHRNMFFFCNLFKNNSYIILERGDEMLGHPELIKFNRKYKALLDYWRYGNCTMQQVLEAIEILEKIQLYKEEK